jgi:hypothetical protein
MVVTALWKVRLWLFPLSVTLTAPSSEEILSHEIFLQEENWPVNVRFLLIWKRFPITEEQNGLLPPEFSCTTLSWEPSTHTIEFLTPQSWGQPRIWVLSQFGSVHMDDSVPRYLSVMVWVVPLQILMLRSLTPYSECDCLWRQGLHRCD